MYQQVNKPKISVIIPIYNVEKYLRECLDSVINQTLKEIEIICVDDGSTDNSGKIIDEYARKDKRIKVVHKKNEGAGIARNIGIKIATGKYLSLIDSDDTYNLQMLNKLYNRAEQDQLDIVVCRSQAIDMRNNKIIKTDWTIKQQLLPNEKIFNYKMLPKYTFQWCIGWSWDKLYNREFVIKNKLEFQNLRHTNDAYFVFISLILATKISVINDILITHKKFTGTQLSETLDYAPMCFIKAIYKIKHKLEVINIYEENEQSFLNWCIDFCSWHYSRLSKNKYKIKLSINKIIKEFKILKKDKNYFYFDNYKKLQQLTFLYTKLSNKILSLLKSFIAKY